MFFIDVLMIQCGVTELLNKDFLAPRKDYALQLPVNRTQDIGLD